ncbi:TRAP transporter small permease [Salicibibacter cibarius]|uniref:TRAP transporter small permease n=1 Tax=Salicibibacter cibarius TaxID=2743000 RepID=A0A7T7CAG5_9BACI|nr:TRAP transporter small permease [Salicibibacter cibarius]QQK74704.1 TRAP transporter small permease [Salicibibacter cibarius]
MKILDRLEEIFISVTIMLGVLLVFVNAILRFIDIGNSWSEELTRYLIIWSTFIGASVCVRKGMHISIDLLPQLLKGAKERVLKAFIHLSAIVFSLILVVYSLEFVFFSAQMNQITPGLNIPFYIVYCVIPISGVLLTIRYIQNFINVIISSKIN